MGSGKSAVGSILARLMDRQFFDLDRLIEEQEGLEIGGIFERKGEIYFRKLEAKVLREFLKRKEPCVLALGGGTPCYAQNMEYLTQEENVLTIFLKAELRTLIDRLWSQREKRPFIAHLASKDALEDFIRKHLFERVPFYLLADQQVTTDGLRPEEVARKIVLDLF
jgi:shikimate kinase